MQHDTVITRWFSLSPLLLPYNLHDCFCTWLGMVLLLCQWRYRQKYHFLVCYATLLLSTAIYMQTPKAVVQCEVADIGHCCVTPVLLACRKEFCSILWRPIPLKSYFVQAIACRAFDTSGVLQQQCSSAAAAVATWIIWSTLNHPKWRHSYSRQKNS